MLFSCSLYVVLVGFRNVISDLLQFLSQELNFVFYVIYEAKLEFLLGPGVIRG